MHGENGIGRGITVKRHEVSNIHKEDQRPVSERWFSENLEYVNPEIRETLGFTFQNRRYVKPQRACVKPVSQREVTYFFLPNCQIICKIRKNALKLSLLRVVITTDNLH